MHDLVDHFTYVLSTWAVKCHCFVGAFLKRYALDILHWSISLIAWTSFWSDLFDGDDTMDTILDTTKVFPYSFCFGLLPTDDVWNYFFCFCRVIALAFCFGKIELVIAIMVSFPVISEMQNYFTYLRPELCSTCFPWKTLWWHMHDQPHHTNHHSNNKIKSSYSGIGTTPQDYGN